MEMIRQVVVFDAADVDTESAFWAGLFEGDVVDDDEQFHCVLDAAGAWCIGVQLAPNHAPPQWPDGTPQQQVHVDLHVDDIERAREEALRLGARLLQAAPNFDSDEGHEVFASPAGHPFCIGWGHPSPDALAAFVERRFGKRPRATASNG